MCCEESVWRIGEKERVYCNEIASQEKQFVLLRRGRESKRKRESENENVILCVTQRRERELAFHRKTRTEKGSDQVFVCWLLLEGECVRACVRECLNSMRVLASAHAAKLSGDGALKWRERQIKHLLEQLWNIIASSMN